MFTHKCFSFAPFSFVPSRSVNTYIQCSKWVFCCWRIESLGTHNLKMPCKHTTLGWHQNYMCLFVMFETMRAVTECHLGLIYTTLFFKARSYLNALKFIAQDALNITLFRVWKLLLLNCPLALLEKETPLQKYILTRGRQHRSKFLVEVLWGVAWFFQCLFPIWPITDWKGHLGQSH